MSTLDRSSRLFTGSAPATAVLLGGHIDMSFDTMPSIWSSVQAGNLRALGFAALQRTEV
jgi:tripartite-type tricarboxylate transporter receptor subunit TctC